MKLIDYIQGKRHGKEANRLEREALNDPFLRDAIEGFDAVQGDHLASINQLEKELKRRTTQKTRVVANRWWVIGAAASLILVLGIGSLMHFVMQVPENIALRAPKVIVPVITDSDSIIRPIKEPVKEVVAHHISSPVSKDYHKKEVTACDKIPNDSKIDSQELTGAISQSVLPILEVTDYNLESLDSAKVEKIILSTTDNVLQGKIAGVAVTTHSGYLKPGLSEMADLNEPRKITGKVVDEAGEPLIGVSVSLKGTKIGTITDLNGNYELQAPTTKTKDLKLTASYIGYAKTEVSADANIIKLEPDNLALNEVVVIGYGTPKHKSATGSISNAATQEFGNAEFKTYYHIHKNSALCNTTNTSLKASFFIDATGKAIDIKVLKAPCPEMEQDFIKILQNSPEWTHKNRKVKITIRF